MKLVIGAVAALLLVPAASPVRYEAEGIRVGGDLVAGSALVLKSVDASTLLVSGSAVESLGAPVAVALDAAHDLTLQNGLRVVRQAGGFLLTSHGPALVIEAAGRTLEAASPVAFTLTEKGFDFPGLGAVESLSVAARTSTSQDNGVVSPERRAQARAGQRALNRRRRVFAGFNPFVAGSFAEREALTALRLISFDGSN